jgi:hypothetical protein
VLYLLAERSGSSSQLALCAIDSSLLEHSRKPGAQGGFVGQLRRGFVEDLECEHRRSKRTSSGGGVVTSLASRLAGANDG